VIPFQRSPRAFWISLCNVFGLGCSLAGVLLLFYFALPNEVPAAPALLSAGGVSPDWEKQQQRYNKYAHAGLTLAFVDTIMETVPPICTALGAMRRRRAATRGDYLIRQRWKRCLFRPGYIPMGDVHDIIAGVDARLAEQESKILANARRNNNTLDIQELFTQVQRDRRDAFFKILDEEASSQWDRIVDRRATAVFFNVTSILPL
jgi:hypothetical protein